MDSRERTRIDAKKRLLGLSLLFGSVGLMGGSAAAFLANSLSLYADLVRHAVDTLATLISWLALSRLKKHGHRFDFGIGKVESLLGILVAAGLLASVYAIFGEALARLHSPRPLGGIACGLAVNIVGIFGNGYMWRKLWRNDRDNPSPVIEAKWKSHRISTLTCAGLIVPLLAGKFLAGQPGALYVDPAVSLGFAAYILWTVYEIAARALGDLSDRTLDEALQLVIMRELARFYAEYEQVHGIRSRRSGGGVYIELYLEFDPERRVGEVDQVMDRMRESLQSHIRHSRVTVVPARCKPA
ncbi:MAG: cation diffusion facilitator family transporter [Elusimicrobia bacterium]|nr:cation diffusion facilitator family transporter [Elusimicrobiota bacterium]